MHDMGLVSIIVPVYNVENYIKRCLDSIIHQTYRNIEIIIVDDGSTDSSATICDEYGKKDGRVIVIHKVNGGLSEARNVGIETAGGDYLSFVDSDDFIASNMIECILSKMKMYDAEIGVCAYQNVFENNLSKMNDMRIPAENDTKVLLGKQLLAGNSVSFIDEVVAWAKIYKTQLFNFIRFPVGHIHEDHYTTYKVLYKAKNVVCINQKLYYYLRDRTDSITNCRHDMMEISNAINEKILFLIEKRETELSSQVLYSWLFMNASIYNHSSLYNEINRKTIVKQMQTTLKRRITYNKTKTKYKVVFFLATKNIQVFLLLNRINDIIKKSAKHKGESG